MRRAPLVDLSLEVPRTWAAYAQFAAAGPRLSRVPKGDGHPVLVLPGFLASDLSTVPLRRYLERLGYPTHGWGPGRNLGPTRAVLEALARSVDEVRRAHSRSLSIVGWSLGGVFGRELARQFPKDIRQVVSLGSPFNDVDAGGLPMSADPLPVPSTAIYTRTDGIVDWRATVQLPDERSENVEVRGSHCGLGVNPAVVLTVADRLAQPEGSWAPFRPPATVQGWFPRPWPSDEDHGTVSAEEQSWTA